ncbi:MAG: amidohydrolase family protein, partial [Gammaproteobacteria bacterium]|nr:amidohydrolase family protein [Gammaproteobacteria bacterium]
MMLRTKAIPLLLAALLSACAKHPSGDSATSHADTVFINGAVYTMDAARSWQRAVAIRDDRIVYVGPDAGVDEFKGPDTRIIDLGGKMLMPSFQDAHVHPIAAGRDALTVDLTGLNSIDAYVAAIKSYADANPDVEWILGGGWTMDIFGPGARASKTLI